MRKGISWPWGNHCLWDKASWDFNSDLECPIQTAARSCLVCSTQHAKLSTRSAFAFSVRDWGCRSAPFLLHTWEQSHQQCASIPSPERFLHLDSYGLSQITCKWCLLVRWHISSELSDSQWGSAHFSTQPPKCAAALGQPAWGSGAATGSLGYLRLTSALLFSKNLCFHRWGYIDYIDYRRISAVNQNNGSNGSRENTWHLNPKFLGKRNLTFIIH